MDDIAEKREAEIAAFVRVMEPWTNETQQESMIKMLREVYHGAKYIDVETRRDGVVRKWEADWIKHLPRALAREYLALVEDARLLVTADEHFQTAIQTKGANTRTARVNALEALNNLRARLDAIQGGGDDPS